MRLSTGLHHISTGPNIPTLFLRHKKRDDVSSQRKIRRYARKSFLLMGVIKHGCGSPGSCWISMLGAIQASAGHGPEQPHPNLTTVPSHLNDFVILCISKIQRFDRESFLELMTVAYPPAGPGQRQRVQRFFHGSGLPDLPP